MSESLFDVHTAAERLGLSYHTVYRLIARGAMPHFKIGSAVRFNQQHLDQFLSAHEVRPVSAGKGLRVVS
jgi:excisionase family DNA binding protein